jgi:energy-coupling factor transporter ATP-binding protein EcfA2
MNGSLLGMKQHEIKAKFDDIISFSETGRFIDTPVKHYSSGMQVRLAFSVAIHLETEILIIDEVLSVGDIAFQQKSMKAIKSLLEKNITVIMVSHNIENIRNLCDKVLILKDGKIDGFGDVREQTQLYISQKFKQIEAPSFKSWKTDDLTKNDIIKILTIGVKAKTKEFGEKIYNSDDLEIVINFNVKVKTPCIDVAFKVKDATNYVLLGVITDRNLKEEMIGNYKVKCNIPPYIFNEGLFKIDVRFLKQKVQGKLLYLNSVISFKVCTDMAKNTSRAFQTPGPLKLNTKWEFQKVNLED